MNDDEAKTSRPGLRPAGAVGIGPLVLPYSTLASLAAREIFTAELDPPPPETARDIGAMRAHYDKQNTRLADRMRDLFPVEIRVSEIGGVRVHLVTPPQLADHRRTLICLHGGAFMWGADSGALVEAIPISATMGIQVVAIDYRLAPEHLFPAASDDVVQVYRALLDRYGVDGLGIYGCSAGAVLTAQTVAAILDQGLPSPGAIALLGGAAGEMAGDSIYLAPPLSGLPPIAGREPTTLGDLAYFAGAPVSGPLVSPALHPDVLARFPPSLLIAGGRDFAASSMTDLHLRLDRAGVDARLYIFDGLWHAFQIFPDLPESRSVYQILARFFDRTLAG
jgi:acetyl esterase/lipase